MLSIRKPLLQQWEIDHSSLFKIVGPLVTYEQCREYACRDIARNLTKLHFEDSSIIEIPKGTEFHFFGRVDTNWNNDDPFSYYSLMDSRTFASFSTISNKNISRFGGGLFYIYDIHPEDIVHIFPMDSNTHQFEKSEEKLTWVPSLWYTLEDLEKATLELETLNQISYKVKRDGELIKPIAILAFEELDDYLKKTAEKFQIPIVITHPDDDAVDYSGDILDVDGDYFKLIELSHKMVQKYGISVQHFKNWAV